LTSLFILYIRTYQINFDKGIEELLTKAIGIKSQTGRIP